MSIYILPAAFALCIKLLILFIAKPDSRQAKVFVAMVGVFALQNLCEVLAYLQFFEGHTAEWLLRAYYANNMWMLALMTVYALTISKAGNQLMMSKIAMAAAGITTLLFCMTDLMITGSQSITYALTAMRGSYYFVFQGTIVIWSTVIVGTLFFGSRQLSAEAEKAQCIRVLVAMAPVLGVAVLVVALMVVGVPLNAAGLLPIATTVFLVITFNSEQSSMWRDIRLSVPNTEENNTAKEILAEFSDYSLGHLNHKQATANIERLLVKYKQAKVGNSNTTQLAKAMGVPRPSIYHIRKRLGIHEKEGSS